MIINKLLKYSKLQFKFSSNNFFESYEDQKRFLNRFSSPKSNVERSYYQYQCQNMSKSTMVTLFRDLSAILLILYYLIRPYKEPKSVDCIKDSKRAVFLRTGITLELLPDSLKTEFKSIFENDLINAVYLSADDRTFIYKIITKYYCKPFFILKSIIKIGIYSNVISKYRPDAIITHNEYSFTSSILTEYCHHRQILHINVMHGEKLYDIHDAFVSFDRYYVWDQHYVDLLIDLGSDEKQFIIEKPRVLFFNNINCKKIKYDLTYYLGGESDSDLTSIRESLILTEIDPQKICIRYHPRFSDEKQIRSIFNVFVIENPLEVSLENSLSVTKYAVSLYSTVLYQAFINDKSVVIDDVSNYQNFNTLKELMYIMMSKSHLLLSDLIKKDLHNENNLDGGVIY